MLSSTYIVCIIALLILAAIVNHSAYMDERKNHLFLLAIFSNIVILAGYLGRGYAECLHNVPLAYISNVIIYATAPLCAFFLLISTTKKGSTCYIVALFLEILSLIVAVTSPWTKITFIIDADGIYSRGKGYWISMAIGMLLLTLWLYKLLRIYRYVEFKKRFYILLLAFFEIMTICLQAKDSSLKIIYISGSFVLAIYYAFIMEVDGRYDPMTGVFSKRYYYSEIEHLSKDDDYIAFMIDGNDLKLINDNYGHDAGDLAIEAIGQAVLKIIGPYAKIFRMGGDEFIGYSTELNSGSLQKLMDKVDARLKEQSQKLGFEVSAAKGYAVHKNDEDFCEVLKRADVKMYENKNKLKAK